MRGAHPWPARSRANTSAVADAAGPLAGAGYWLLALAPPVVELAAWALSSLPRRVGLLEDDAYYYLVVARHLAGGGGSTFNGIDPTNGYHPLWMGFLVPVQAIAASPPTTIGLVLLVQSLVWAATVRELWRIGQRLENPALTVIASLPLAFIATANHRLSFNGMESTLVLLLLTRRTLRTGGFTVLPPARATATAADHRFAAGVHASVH